MVQGPHNKVSGKGVTINQNYSKNTCNSLHFYIRNAVSLSLAPSPRNRDSGKEKSGITTPGCCCSSFSLRRIIAISGTVFGIRVVGNELLSAGCAGANNPLVISILVGMLFPPCVFAFYGAEALACSGFFWQPFPTHSTFPGTRLFLPMHKYLQRRNLYAQLR